MVISLHGPHPAPGCGQVAGMAAVMALGAAPRFFHRTSGKDEQPE